MLAKTCELRPRAGQDAQRAHRVKGHQNTIAGTPQNRKEKRGKKAAYAQRQAQRGAPWGRRFRQAWSPYALSRGPSVSRRRSLAVAMGCRQDGLHSMHSSTPRRRVARSCRRCLSGKPKACQRLCGQTATVAVKGAQKIPRSARNATSFRINKLHKNKHLQTRSMSRRRAPPSPAGRALLRNGPSRAGHPGTNRRSVGRHRPQSSFNVRAVLVSRLDIPVARLGVVPLYATHRSTQSARNQVYEMPATLT